MNIKISYHAKQKCHIAYTEDGNEEIHVYISSSRQLNMVWMLLTTFLSTYMYRKEILPSIKLPKSFYVIRIVMLLLLKGP